MCGEHIEGVTIETEKENLTEYADRLLELAVCLREQGVEVDDPDTSAEKPGLDIGAKLKKDWDSPAMLQAREACDWEGGFWGSQVKDNRRRVLLVVGSVVGAAALAALVWFLGNGSSSELGGAESLNYVEVVITDLVQKETFAGTLGSIDDDPVRTQLGGTITEIGAPGDTVVQGGTLFSIDGEPVVLLYGELPTFRDIAIGEESVTVSSQLFGAITSVAEPGTVIQQGDVLYSVDGLPVIALYGDVPAFRDVAISEESVTVSSQLFGTITSVAERGAVLPARRRCLQRKRPACGRALRRSTRLSGHCYR